MIYAFLLTTIYATALAPQYKYAGCTQGGGWVRPFGDVSNDIDGAISCRDQCEQAGYEYWGLECPRSTVHCQCLSGSMGTFIDDHMCSEFNVNSGGHCSGPFVAESTNAVYFLGAGSVSSVYHTNVFEDDNEPANIEDATLIFDEPVGILPTTAFICGLEHFSEDCWCHGEVVYGYGEDLEKWSESVFVDSYVRCDNGEFGDPFPGQDKFCVCIGMGSVVQSDNIIPEEFLTKAFAFQIDVTEEPAILLEADFHFYNEACAPHRDTVPDSLVNINGPRTIFASMIMPDAEDFNGKRQWLFNIGTGSQLDEHWLWNGGDSIQFGAWSGAAQVHTLNNFLDCNTLATTWDGETYKLFCNGVLQESLTPGANFFHVSDNIVDIGHRAGAYANGNSDADFAGCLEDTFIWSTALSDEDIAIFNERFQFEISSTQIESTDFFAECESCPESFWHYGGCGLCFNGQEYCAIGEFDLQMYGHLDIDECEFQEEEIPFFMVGSTMIDDGRFYADSEHHIVEYGLECNSKPIFIPGPLSNNDPKTAHTRAKVDDDHAEIWLSEPSCSDGNHDAEHFDYLFLEDNVLYTEGDNMLQTGSLDMGADYVSTFTRIDFPVAFPSDDVVILAHIQTYEGPNYVKIRVHSVDSTGFMILMEEHEGSDFWHVVERIGWVASTVGVYSYAGNTLEFGLTDLIVTSELHDIAYQQIAEPESTHFFGLAQTYEGANPMSLRKTDWKAEGITIYIQEDVCADSETEHTEEVVGWLKVTPGWIPSGSPTSSVPSATPTEVPTSMPSVAPSQGPTVSYPSMSPSNSPSNAPSASPSVAPSGSPSAMPTTAPTSMPTTSPSSAPSTQPTSMPTTSPSSAPSTQPTSMPTTSPTSQPTQAPSTSYPTQIPSAAPTSTCVTFELSCAGNAIFDGSYAKADSFRDVWMSGDKKLERLFVSEELQWIIESKKQLLVAKTNEEDFRLIQTWVHQETELECLIACSDSHFPTMAPSFTMPSNSPSVSPETSEPTAAPRYPIELEHHLSGVSEGEFQDIEPLYIDALTSLFHVEREDVQILDVEEIVYNKKRRVLQGSRPEMRVTCSVSFLDLQDMEFYVDSLATAEGRAAMNEWFAFMLTNHATSSGITVAHMGIEGEFDIISYFTTSAPTFAPSGTPSSWPTSAPTEYVDAGSAVHIQEDFEGTMLTLVFEGAEHDDVDLHRAITDIIDEEALTIIDASVVLYEITEEGNMMVSIDVDCQFNQCAVFYRNQTLIEHYESRMQSEKGFQDFSILSFDVSKMRDGAMTEQVATAEGSFMLLAMVLGLMLSLVMCYNYWKVCFCMSKKEEDMMLDLGEYVDEVIAVEHKSQFFSTNSLSSVCESQFFSGNEGMETIQDHGVAGAVYTETVDMEGFAATKPFSPVEMIKQEDLQGESLYRDRADTQECNVDVQVDSPRSHATPFQTRGYISNVYNNESDSSITLYGSSGDEAFRSDDDAVLAGYWASASQTQF